MIVAILLSFTSALAYDFEVDGYCYYKLTNSTCALAHPGGNGALSRYSGNVRVPEQVTYRGVDYTVTQISSYAFSWSGSSGGNNAELLSVILPSKLEIINPNAFSGCNKLSTITIPSSVTKVDYTAFDGCSNIKEVVLQEGVLPINFVCGNTYYRGVFSDCPLTKVYIGRNITLSLLYESYDSFCFSNGPFSWKSNLTDVTITDNVTELPDYLFYCNSSMTNIVLSNNIQKIGRGTFRNCSNLNTVIIGQGLQSIDYQAFKSTSRDLKIYLLSNTLNNIGSDLCPSETKFYVLDKSVYDALLNDYEIIRMFDVDNLSSEYTGLPCIPVVKNNTPFDLEIYAPSNVGLYNNIMAKIFAYSNIIETNIPCNVEITKAPIIAIANDVNRQYGHDNPELKCSYFGFKNDETADVLTRLPNVETTATINSPVGTYPIIVTGAEAQNYTFNYERGTLTVTKANQEIEWNQTFGTVSVGDVVELTASSTSNLPIKYTVTDESIAEIYSQVGKKFVKFLKSGNVSIQASQGGNENYNEADNVTKTIVVNPVVAYGVTLNAQDLTLLVGQSDKLTATVEPANTTVKDVVWNSDNEAVATVAADGTVTAVSVGVANITATCGSVSATCKVAVNPVAASGVTLNVQDMALLVGQTDKLTATVEPANTTVKDIVWSSDNEAIATVTADGTVCAVSVGVANITATCGTVSATCKVTVKPVDATSIELSLKDITLLIGSTTTLTAKVYPENTTNQQISWTSSNPSIASIDERGTITALQVGEAVVTATCGTVTATCKVTVTPVSPISIDLNIKDMIIFIGQSETIQAIVRPSNTTYPTVTWRSDDETVATVSADGKVTGIKEGVSTITATCGEVSATCKVTVNPIPASNIEIVTGDVTLTIGSTTDLVAKVSPDNTTHPEVEWLSSDTNIATITDNGTVMAVNIGTAIITAKCGNVSATCTVTVIPVPSEGIVISPTSISMLLGDEATLTATVFPENTTNKTVTWGSDNPAVASVSSTGVVTALGLGTATITASNGNAKATCLVTVNPVVATSISLNVKDETLFVASTTQLIATISPANVTDKTITWTSSNPEIATVSDEGIILGIAVGTATVTATCGDVSASCQINVVHRIPDLDPSVRTSDRDISTLSDRHVNMTVYAEGGEPTGWSYVWTRNGEVISKSSELNITARNETETVIAETYRVKVENEIDKVVILSEVFDFVVRIYPAIDERPDDGGISVTNGTGNMLNKTREGNTITLSAATPTGGNPQGWEFAWKDANGNIGDGEMIETVAAMSAGQTMAVEQSSYYLEMTNYSPEGEIWGQFNLESTIDVYRRPQTPVQMLRKGDGASHTFVVMMPMSDAEFERLEYKLVYGWTDRDGANHIIEQSNLRYCRVDTEVYNNAANKFWVYSKWYYQDGSVVSSGLRYLDGSVDESFDASVFDGTDERNVMSVKAHAAVYSIDGRYMGTEVERLAPGIYIYIYEKDGEMVTEKIIIR